MAIPSYMYCTVDDMVQTLKIESDIDNDQLTRYIKAASRKINTACGDRVFSADAPSTRYFDAISDVRAFDLNNDIGYTGNHQRRVLWLDHDLCRLDSVQNGDGVAVNLTDIVTEPRNYSPFYALRLKINANVVWTFVDTPENAIAVTGLWAYSETPPDDIVQATIRLTSFLYRQRDNNTDVDRPLMSGDGAIIMPTRLPADVVDYIRPYVRSV